MRLLFAALLTAGQAFAQQAPAKSTEQQARSTIATAFITGAAPAVLSETVTVSPELRQRLGLAPEADSKAAYKALAAMTSGKPVQVRRAEPDEIDKGQTPAAPDRPIFVLESGDATLIVQYDLDQDNIAFIGLPGTVAVAAPVVAPTPPQRVPETPAEAPKPAVVAAPPAAAAPSLQKPEPLVLQVVEPQVPRAMNPGATAPVRPAQPAAAVPPPEARPLLRKSGPCEIKPVMSDQDLVNCGATPR
ncbi:MAG TPA: hypothetical protein VEQ87_07020 [Burkholderiales bacterium]|nr:hypothetical protein [Burkholderiales bacterium]